MADNITSPTRIENHLAQKAAKRTSIVGAVVNLTLTAVKGVIGALTGSQALIADAVHSASDLLTDIIAFVAVQLGREDADEGHPYGHGKFETFGTLILSVLLALVASGIIINVVDDFLHGTPQKLTDLALIAAGLSILLNEGLFRYALHEGTKVNSKPIIANAWHHRADGLSSIAVFVGIGLNMLGFVYGDYIAAAIVAIMLFKISYGFGHDAFNELVDAAVPKKQQQRMLTAIKNSEGVLDCHMLRARHIGGDIMVDVHVDVDPRISVSEGHHIAELVEFNINKEIPNAIDITVHIDPAKHEHEPPKAAAALTRNKLEKIINNTINNTIPDAVIEHITLHFIGAEKHADIIFSHISQDELNKHKKAIIEELTNQENLFSTVSFSLKL